jgi:hypothetical protein
MHITGTELAAASSAVAALAIVGGYLGVHSANQNALKISREERSTRRKEELDALKRGIYAKTVSDLVALAAANIESSALLNDPQASPQFRLETLRSRIEAVKAASNSITELVLISTNNLLRDLANEALNGAMKCTSEDAAAFTRGISKLQVSLRDDLSGKEISSADELNRMVDNTLTKQSSTEKTTEDTH